MVDQQKMRASDRDRQQVVEQLRSALEDGRLTMDEYVDRMEVAYQAATYGDLAPLCADLPASTPVVELSAGDRFALDSRFQGRCFLGERFDLVDMLGFDDLGAPAAKFSLAAELCVHHLYLFDQFLGLQLVRAEQFPKVLLFLAQCVMLGADFLISQFDRNGERYAFLKWGQSAFRGLRVVPPDTGIVHQVNLEFLASVTFREEGPEECLAYFDSLVGTDSHTTMINGLGVLGWGVGGLEAEAALLGHPIGESPRAR